MERADLKPGDFRIFKNKKSVVLAVGIWAKRQGENRIRIDITGTGKHTTVTNDRGSERYHRTLFRDLRRILIEHGCWSFGDEGVETNISKAVPQSQR